MELSRRYFLGGTISLLAANTFVPSPSASGNLPRIWGDGRHDDTSGLGALFRKEPVILAPDKVGVDEHRGISFHAGRFKITQTIEVPEGLEVHSEGGTTFDLLDLDRDLYALRGTPGALVPFTGKFAPTYYYYRPRRNAYYENDVCVHPAVEAYGVPDRRRILETVDTEPSEEELCGYGEMSAELRAETARKLEAAAELHKHLMGVEPNSPEWVAAWEKYFPFDSSQHISKFVKQANGRP